MSEFILQKELDYETLFKIDYSLLSKIIEALVTVTKQTEKKMEDLVDNDKENNKIITK